jgi:hypothetical protein
MPGLKMMMIDTDVSWLEKIGVIILLPILLILGFGSLLSWLVLQSWKAVGSSVFLKKFFRRLNLIIS